MLCPCVRSRVEGRVLRRRERRCECVRLAHPVDQLSCHPLLLICSGQQDSETCCEYQMSSELRKSRAGRAWKSLLLSGERLPPLIKEQVQTHTYTQHLLAALSSPQTHYEICSISLPISVLRFSFLLLLLFFWLFVLSPFA